MITLWLLLIPAVAALLAYGAGSVPGAARTIAVLAMAINSVLLAAVWFNHGNAAETSVWWAEWSGDWLPQLGIRVSLGLDGLSLVLSLMSCVAALAALVATPPMPRGEGVHSALFLAGVTGVLGVFLARDLMFFFVCYEVMLLPVFALIIRWGSGDARRTAMRFFVFTQTGGLLMFISILGLYVARMRAGGGPTFDIETLRGAEFSASIAMLLLLGFFFAFAVKLPLVPFHTWQAPTYESAPTATAILLSALMAKTAGYGFLRLALPYFPDAAERLAPVALVLGVITVVYASWTAYGQRDIKRLIAYSSAGHLGYIVLGVFALNDLGRTGAIVQMVCHGLSVTGMFLIADHVERRTGSRDLDQLGGLWNAAPRLGGLGLVFTLATLGLPGLGNFVGEFMVLAGVFQANPAIGAIAALGAVLSAAYALRMFQRVFFGVRTTTAKVTELPGRSLIACAALIVVLIWIGLYPKALVDTVNPAVIRQQNAAAPGDRP